MYSHKEWMGDRAENNSFYQLTLPLVSSAQNSMRACFKELYMQICIVKRFTKTTPTPTEAKKNDFTSEVELST